MTNAFWEAFCSWLCNFNVKFQPFTIMDILFGVSNTGDDYIILNHLTLTAKLDIYKCKLNIVDPSLRVCNAKIRAVYQLEKKIAARRNKLTKHFQKWEKRLPYVSS